MNAKARTQRPKSVSSAVPFCRCPFAPQHSVTATKTANRQCQWPCSHSESASTHGNYRHTVCPEPGQREIRKGSKGPRHKGPAACRALALHRGKQGLLITPHACDPSFYSVVVPNGKNQRWKQELSAKYILKKTITAQIITDILKYHMRLVHSDHNQTTSESCQLYSLGVIRKVKTLSPHLSDAATSTARFVWINSQTIAGTLLSKVTSVASCVTVKVEKAHRHGGDTLIVCVNSVQRLNGGLKRRLIRAHGGCTNTSPRS